MDVSNREEERLLHERMCKGDVTASAEIAEQLLLIVVRQLRHRYYDLDDPHLADTAVHEAFISYFQHPERYNPSKSSLSSYLLMAAAGDLRNLLDSRIGESQLAIDTHNGDDESAIVIADDFDLEAEVVNGLSPVWPALREHLPNPVDRTVVQLMLDNVRDTVIYAKVLGIQDRPAKEQQLIVKRCKDRLRKKLRRLIDQSEFRHHG